MDLFKNPFSKKREGEQLTPDLLSPQEKQKPERAKEQDFEKDKEKIDQLKESQAEQVKSSQEDKPSLKTPAPRQVPLAATKAISLQKIENILQEDLEELYFDMDEAHRRMLKQEGERAAQQIEKVLTSGKSVAIKVLEIIKSWLRLIPGINKFFIEQEAKIKTDKIIKINQPD